MIKLKDALYLSDVAEVATRIVLVGSTNRDGTLDRSRAIVACILSVVTGSHGKQETLLDGTLDSHIKSLRLSTTQRHVGDSADMFTYKRW